MKDIDFKICRFIEENMYFLTYNDFCDNREIIKELFQQLDKNGRLFYKWYVYANIHMNETYKNYIWDYLVGYDDGINLMYKRRFYKAH